MKTIRFSHRYEKMPAYLYHTKLMQVFVSDSAALSPLLINYDTIYLDHGIYRHYELPKGKVLVLVLITGHTGTVWTTIRRWTPKKEAYYTGLTGQEVTIAIMPEGGE